MWRWRRAVDLLFPAVCAGCELRSREAGFCDDCRRDMASRHVASCPTCGRALRSGDDRPCQRCLQRQPPYERLWAAATYWREAAEAPLNRAIRRLKYDRDVSFARPLADMMTEMLRRRGDQDLIVPVPLYIDRLRWRGFNQAVVIARPLARSCGTILDPMILRRRRATLPQVGLDEAARRLNMRGAFDLRPGRDVRDLRILLVDDVYTTGATVEECARVLRSAGASRIDVAVVARAI